jgi:hypothetical protein
LLAVNVPECASLTTISAGFRETRGDFVITTGSDRGVQMEFQVPSLLGERTVVEVPYTDVAGGQYRRTQLLILKDSPTTNDWHVVGFALFTGRPPVEPTLMSGPWRPEDGLPR